MKNSQKVKVGVVGAGRPNIATVNHLPAIERSDKVELAAICDINEGVFDYARKYNVLAYTNYLDLLEDDNVEAVLIATPDWLHCEQVKYACNSRKHILCEKPVTLTMEEFYEIRRAVEESGVVFQAGHVRRFHPVALKIKSIVDSGQLGKVVHVRISTKGAFFPYPKNSPYRNRETGGQFIHNGPHYVDWLCLFANGRPINVNGRTLSYYPDPSQAMETDNYTLATVRFDNGVIGLVEQNLTLTKSAEYPAKDTVQIIGTKASLNWCNHDNSALSWNDGHCSYTDPSAVAHRHDSFLFQIDHFAECIQTGQTPQVGLDLAQDVMEICTGTLNSAKKTVAC